MKKQSFLLFYCLLFTLNSLAQVTTIKGEGLLSGRILDKENDQPLEYVSFKLYSSKDSTLITGIYTNAEGKFSLDKIPIGNYYGKIVFTGFRNKIIEDIKISSELKVANLGTIKLEHESAGDLKEIKVTGSQDILKAGIDKKVYNVGEDLSVKGGTANDVLYNIPSVELDQDGNIILRGSGTVNILIDGRPSSLTGGNGKTLLDALPAGSIERIEVVTNPSARYDPDGTAGIINIVLKKNKLRGFNGLLSANLGTGDLKGGNVADGSASLSFRNSKFNLYGSYSGRYLTGYRNNYSKIDQTLSNGETFKIDQDRIGTDLNAGNTFRGGIDLYLKTRHFLVVSFTGSNGQRNRTGEQWNAQYNASDSLLALWKRNSDDPTRQQNLDINLNYKYDFKNDGGNIVFDMNQSLGKENIEGYYWQNYYDADSILLGLAEQRQQLVNKEKNNITTAQLDVVRMLKNNKGRLEVGTKMILRDQLVDTYSESIDSVTGLFLADTLANFKYAYEEKVFSGYSIFGQQFKKFKYQIGVRLEQAYQIPNLISQEVKLTNAYFNFFPSGHLRYSLTPKSELSLSYSRRINRSAAADMNPFTNYSDPLNLRRGNPSLKPEYIDSYDFGFTNDINKLTITTSVYYRYTTSVISRIKEFYENNTSVVTFANIDQSQSVGLEAIFIYKPFKWWKNNFSFNGSFTQYSDDNTSTNWNVGGYNFNMKYVGSVEFWKKTATLQINAAYNGPRVTVQGTAQRRGPVDISAEKTFNEGKWSLGFRVTDIFNRQGFTMKISQPNVRQEAEFKWLTRRVFILLSYKFGKLEMSNKKSSSSEGGYDM